MIEQVSQTTFTEPGLEKGLANVRVQSVDLNAEDDNTLVCVVGVGYVGEILLREFGSVFPAIGFDVSPQRVEGLKPEFESLPNVQLTADPEKLFGATHYLISVPTLVRQDKSIDASHLLRAVDTVVRYASPGAAIVIESSVSVGMTRALLSQYLGRFRCGMSPERVDPGRTVPAPREIPKVISGLDEDSLTFIKRVYAKVFQRVVLVSKPEVAEMSKLYENCYRMINIAYVNEIADACALQNIDVNEVVDAASTKPFGFQPFRSGLGVGGHCIPINPYYLMINNKLPLLKKATNRMAARPEKLARLYHRRQSKLAVDSPRILVIGVAFKQGQSVVSCSPALSFAQELKKQGCNRLNFYDPFVEQKQISWMEKLPTSAFTTEYLDKNFDGVAVCMKQAKVDFGVLKELKKASVKLY